MSLPSFDVSRKIIVRHLVKSRQFLAMQLSYLSFLFMHYAATYLYVAKHYAMLCYCQGGKLAFLDHNGSQKIDIHVIIL